jgi:hypothetical protein
MFLRKARNLGLKFHGVEGPFAANLPAREAFFLHFSQLPWRTRANPACRRFPNLLCRRFLNRLRVAMPSGLMSKGDMRVWKPAIQQAWKPAVHDYPSLASELPPGGAVSIAEAQASRYLFIIEPQILIQIYLVGSFCFFNLPLSSAPC